MKKFSDKNKVILTISFLLIIVFSFIYTVLRRWDRNIQDSVIVFSDAEAIQEALQKYQIDNGVFPGSIADLNNYLTLAEINISRFEYTGMVTSYRACFYIKDFYGAQKLKKGQNCFGPDEKLKY